MSRRSRNAQPRIRYWHAGWSGRQVGEVLLPLARQTNEYAQIQTMAVEKMRQETDDPDLASGHIYDLSKLYVTTDRDFAHAWSVSIPTEENRAALKLLYGIPGTAYYEVELLDEEGSPLSTEPEPDPDYPRGGCFQVQAARVLAVHRPQMSPTAATVHMERMGAPAVIHSDSAPTT
ncbi:hypothetical protein [Mycobacteroides abscessus]|uniref:hypothetical protein n=1 Tax=Mycobacteroides abscessus TaxID=36809 RepID=UPI002102BE60|nr:hypothetical protein [Mycobacteroides abscessus]